MKTLLLALALLAGPPAALAALLVDVRTPAEYAEGHLPGAVNLPLDTLQATIVRHAPDRSSRIELYCRSGRRSAAAAGLLRGLGYRDVHDLGSYTAAAQATNSISCKKEC